MSSRSVFRLATINVHGFQNSKGRTNVDKLISILKPLNIDLLAVEEVANDKNWTKLCHELSLKYFLFGSTYGSSFGNGLASKHPFHSSSDQKTSSYYSGGTRGIIQCRLQGLEQIQFAVTHLDHLDEDNRLKQIQEFHPIYKNIDILIGDMNALTRDDYTENYYRNIVEGKRRQSNWELPRFDLINLLTNQWKYEDIFRIANPQSKDEQVVTCDYGTRIDYIFVQPRILQIWQLSSCQIIDTKGATDHNAVLAQFLIS